MGLLNLAPTLFVLALLVTLGVGLFLNWLPLLLLAVVYLATSILASALSFRAAATASWRFACLPLLFLLMHLGYGAGTLLGALRGLFRSQARNFGAYV